MENKNQRLWTRLPKDNLNKDYFYNENTSFMCNYSDVFPNKSVIMELVADIVEFCEERLKIKISNQENSIAIRQLCDKNKLIIGYEISLNDNTKNQDLFPNKKFLVNTFFVKNGPNFKERNNYLTKKLHQLQQQENPYYYIYLANYVMSCVYSNIIKERKIDYNKLLGEFGLRYNNEFRGTKGMRLENILYDKKYFYREINNQFEKN